MTIGTDLLPEFDNEMAGTRKALERIPDDKLHWKIHEKSNTIGWVAAHIVNLPTWASMTIENDFFDMNPPGGEPFKTPSFDSVAEILAAFDRNVSESRSLLESVSDEELHKPWSLKNAGETLFTMPKLAVIRTWVLNHIIHHRAHLCVYLRMNDIPVPGLYGPSGDE
ncbi:DinB superfamily protein [Roseimaritima multifibrata]|uniref:DinB superfamily protein n=1 Tax=Roseimaritima multifibrata TaxID=1930274 RepID=A0A517MGU3_9BACT|nr:DinB family protein [Roseimaritima multifibrata]QDS93987.1 DinB superfamily protein [Roseimaritima multifibrata]